MAYLAFQDLNGMATVRHAYRPAPTPDAAPPATDDRLTELEWRVVMIARRDGLSTLRRPRPLSTALRALFNRRNPMLADVRLEALRRIAVLTWRRGYTVPPREVSAFLDAGFTPGQYETMVDRISAAKAIPLRTARTAGAATGAPPHAPLTSTMR